jgi:hypothetical protein
MDVVVRASKTNQKAHDAGIFAQVEILLKDGNDIKFRLCDAILRKNKEGKWWIAAPSRAVEVQGTTKYYRYWWIYPEDQDRRREAEDWIVSEVLKQIGDPNEVAAPKNQGAYQSDSQQQAAPAKTRAPFAPSGGGSKPQGQGRINSPFGSGSLVPGGQDFALGKSGDPV